MYHPSFNVIEPKESNTQALFDLGKEQYTHQPYVAYGLDLAPSAI
jgi:hypothetical protein